MKTSAALTLLVVDDNPHIRRIISAWAVAMRFNVSCACDGREAISFLITRQFDLVLTDFDMPGMNGSDLLNWIRKHRPSVPVCMMSAAAASEVFRAKVRPCVDGLLAKPFSAAALDSCVKEALLQKAAPFPG